MQLTLRYWAILIFSVSLFASCTTKRVTVLRPPGGGTVQERRTPSAGGKNRPAQPPSPTVQKGTTSMSGHAYIERYKGIARSEMDRYGIPASIKLAQALLESGNGNSYLAREANNHFGIKCGGVWNGPNVRRPDDGPNDCFRVYQNPEESFRDHSQFLLRKRYEDLFALRKDDYRGWARGLKSAGYATNPRYAELLIDLIERYELHQYDRPETYAQREVREERVEQIIERREEAPATVSQEQAEKSPVAMAIYEVKATDTLYSISRQFGLSVDDLKILNSMDSETIYVGQLLVVSK